MTLLGSFLQSLGILWAHVSLNHKFDTKLIIQNHSKKIVLAAGISILVWVLHAHIPNILTASLLLLYAISFLDDLYNIRWQYRLILQLMVTIIFLSQLQIPIFYTVPFVLLNIWMINAHNFIDGHDGLLLSLTLMALFFMGYILPDKNEIYILIFILMPLWFFNLPCAKVYIGDTGSCTLGFIMMILCFYEQPWYRTSWALLLFAPIMFDTTITLVRRFIYRKNLLTRHHDHAFQRLFMMSNHKWGTLLIYTAIQTISNAGTVYCFNEHLNLWMVFIIQAVILFVLYMILESYAPMRKEND